MTSLIDEIVDYSAAVAAAVSGVVAVFGAGLGEVADPLRPGKTVQAAPSTDQLPELAHVSFLPDAPGVTPFDQDGGYEVLWRIPMRLVLPRSELSRARAVALPFYGRYIDAFWADRRLGGSCALARISRFELATDGTDRWLGIDLEVREIV